MNRTRLPLSFSCSECGHHSQTLLLQAWPRHVVELTTCGQATSMLPSWQLDSSLANPQCLQLRPWCPCMQCSGSPDIVRHTSCMTQCTSLTKWFSDLCSTIAMQATSTLCNGNEFSALSIPPCMRSRCDEVQNCKHRLRSVHTSRILPNPLKPLKLH